jgi:aspartate/glutamate racemase
MRPIGILGGMSWESTAHYYRALNQGVRARLGGLRSARLLLHSVDFGPLEAMQREGRWAEIGAALAEARRGLEAGGAELVLIAGCTEIGMLLQPGDVALPLFDTAELHVEAALDWALAP